MKRRHLLKFAGSFPLFAATVRAQGTGGAFKRVRPGEAGWPSEAEWQALTTRVGGQLTAVHSPFEACKGADKATCDTVFRQFKNPYFIRDNVALTQTTGWAEAWTSSPSAYAIDARNASDVAAAVNFAREHKLRRSASARASPTGSRASSRAPTAFPPMSSARCRRYATSPRLRARCAASTPRPCA
jgi:hypothetical protein